MDYKTLITLLILILSANIAYCSTYTIEELEADSVCNTKYKQGITLDNMDIKGGLQSGKIYVNLKHNNKTIIKLRSNQVLNGLGKLVSINL